jgi:hypothetical protein
VERGGHLGVAEHWQLAEGEIGGDDEDRGAPFTRRRCRWGSCGAGTFSSPLRFLPMMDTFTLLSFVATFLAGATAGAWLNALTNSYGVRAPGHSWSPTADASHATQMVF